jgi:hypothetical protein
MCLGTFLFCKHPVASLRAPFLTQGERVSYLAADRHFWLCTFLHTRLLHHITYYNKYCWKVSGDYISVRSHDGSTWHANTAIVKQSEQMFVCTTLYQWKLCAPQRQNRQIRFLNPALVIILNDTDSNCYYPNIKRVHLYIHIYIYRHSITKHGFQNMESTKKQNWWFRSFGIHFFRNHQHHTITILSPSVSSFLPLLPSLPFSNSSPQLSSSFSFTSAFSLSLSSSYPHYLTQ